MPLETSSLKLGELVVSGKGAKQVPLTSADIPLVWRPGPLRVQWQPKAFNDPEASRVAICFQATGEVEAYVQALESWVLDALSAAPRKYFGQDLAPLQIRERFVSAIKTSQKGYAHLRAKMNLAGRAQVRCWNAEDRKARKQPEDWTMCEVQPCLEIKGLWVMNRDFGLLIEMTDALISESSSICPF
jgi:hypothetical protein